eukprot:snap_masked-scaffold_8-processed-gene-14.43-mRNA-1 protein AED:1.00 eAED:1.00 QI:0/0/0/0/1/1/2/0/101
MIQAIFSDQQVNQEINYSKEDLRGVSKLFNTYFKSRNLRRTCDTMSPYSYWDTLGIFFNSLLALQCLEIEYAIISQNIHSVSTMLFNTAMIINNRLINAKH